MVITRLHARLESNHRLRRRDGEREKRKRMRDFRKSTSDERDRREREGREREGGRERGRV